MATQTTNKDNTSSELTQVGRLWVWVGRNSGEKYLSGFVTLGGKEYPLKVFKNKNKREGKKDADWRVLWTGEVKEPWKPNRDKTSKSVKTEKQSEVEESPQVDDAELE
ncbi:MAG: hypothetical protein AABY22_30525 [Nanoarchaeota archaeon]